jgi:hypothetical protein
MLTCSFFDGVTYQDKEYNGRVSDFFGAGVLHPATDFALTFPGGMVANVGEGSAWNGDGIRFTYNADPVISLTFPQADPVNPRIDLIEIGYAFAIPGISKTVFAQIIVKKGTPAASPAQPAPDTGYVGLYAIRVNAGATSVNSGNVTDLRTVIQLRNIDLPFLPLAGGSLAGDLIMQSHKITNLANGINDGDAVNIGQIKGSIVKNGWQKLPSGLLIQWGILAKGTSVSVNFPIAFTSVPFFVDVFDLGYAGSSIFFGAASITAAGFIAKCSLDVEGMGFIAIGQ